ncbi:metal ABC transporter permease [Halobacteriovorax marinus]|uniref:Metal ABC transporter permease n=1 Tax=Halobacteriovorax marinus TaxID=97084 RepID=A0A1Y5F7P4_9BACT|nr:metal ABC transporter permease [Halobacteriovorax marinus]
MNQNTKTLATLGTYLWPKQIKGLRIRVVIAVLALAVGKLVNIYIPFLLKDAIDALSTTDKVIILPIAVIIAYGLARILVQVFGEVRDLAFIKVAQHAQKTISLETFKHLHNLSLDFHLSRKTGDLSRVIERGTRGIQFVLNFMTFNIVPILLEILLVTAIMLYKFEWVYGTIIFSTIALYIFVTLAVTEWRLKFRRKMNTEESRANSKAIDSLLNFETVKYFGNEEHEYTRFNKNLLRYETAAVASQKSLSILNLAQKTIIGSGLISILLLAGRSVENGSMTIGEFVLVNSFLIQLYLPLDFLGFVYREIKQSLVDMDKMFELIDVNPSIKDDHTSTDLELKGGVIEFKNVNFGYNKDRTILKNVNFKINPGETLAVVGGSGSGKSTILRLLFRFYDVNAGSVLVDGIDIRDVSQESLRSAIGVVPQDTVLFNDTIGYNILYGKPGATEAEMKAAAKAAQVDTFIDSLPDGYDTQVGERGLKLSGGEKQRMAIARTILKAPEILLFDEATSALDSHTEREIQKSFEKVSKDKTTIIIAHRLSTIVRADQIIVLKNGEISESGNHLELLKLNGEYASMWSKQQEVDMHEEKIKECNAELETV